MSGKINALALALEAEHEAEQVADTYQALATVLGVDEEVSDAAQAGEIATGLEQLQAVLESLQEQDIHDISLTQVIGDLAGAATGVSGDLFTPAMEDVEAENDAAERAATLTSRIREIIVAILEKLATLAKWVFAKFRQLVAAMKAGLAKLRQMASKKIDVSRARAIKKRIVMMNDTAKALEDFIPLIAELGDLRIRAAEEPAGYAEEVMDLSMVNEMERCLRSMEAFTKKYGTERYVGNIKFSATTDRLDRQSAQATVLTFSHCYFEVSRTSNGSEALNEAMDGEDVGSPDALINELEAVSTSYARFLGDHGALSLPTLIKAMEKKVSAFKTKTGSFSWMKLGAENVGQTAMKILNMSALAIARDVNVLTKVSSFVTIDASALNGMLNAMVNVEEPETVPA